MITCTWQPYETRSNLTPLKIHRASGSYIHLANGKKIIDAISSWWCKSLGHNHPYLKKALVTQLDYFEHVISANTTHDPITQLSKTLCQTMPHLDKVFYAGDGACAVEIAMKMSLYTRHIQKQKQKNHFITLKNSYHGETLATLSVGDLPLYKSPYQSYLKKSFIIEPLYVNSQADPAYHDAKTYFESIQEHLDLISEQTTAILIEPLIQGAAGMKVISADFLSRLAQWAQQQDVHIIADEIMTGMGRTGSLLACQQAKINADFICLGKGLTSGWLPFSAVMTTNKMYETCCHTNAQDSFLHAHTYSGHVLGACLALATIKIITQQSLCEQAKRLEFIMRQYFNEIKEETQLITNIRGIGAVIAADIINADRKNISTWANHFFEVAIKQGAYLRPIGHSIYWLPPLNILPETLLELKQITKHTLLSHTT